MATYSYVGLEWNEEDDEVVKPILEALEKRTTLKRFNVPEDKWEKLREVV